jgi:hypothetical protein
MGPTHHIRVIDISAARQQRSAECRSLKHLVYCTTWLLYTPRIVANVVTTQKWNCDTTTWHRCVAKDFRKWSVEVRRKRLAEPWCECHPKVLITKHCPVADREHKQQKEKKDIRQDSNQQSSPWEEHPCDLYNTGARYHFTKWAILLVKIISISMGVQWT